MWTFPGLLAAWFATDTLKVLSCFQDPREYQREQRKPIWHTGRGGNVTKLFTGVLPRDAAREAVFSGQDPVHQHQKMYTSHARLSLGHVRKTGLWQQEDVQCECFCGPPSLEMRLSAHWKVQGELWASAWTGPVLLLKGPCVLRPVFSDNSPFSHSGHLAQ